MNRLKHNFLLALTVASTAIVPFLAEAATTKKLSDVIATIVGYLDQILALLMGLAVVLFVYYVIRYFVMTTEKRGEGAQFVMWSLIAFFVILSMWGLVNILISTFDLGQGNPGSWSSLSNLFPQ